MSNDINAARERLEKARERRNGWPSDQPSLLRDHVFAISDLLLAMTAPAASPAKPERVAGPVPEVAPEPALEPSPRVCGICAKAHPLVWATHDAREGVFCGGSGLTPADSYDNEKVRAQNAEPDVPAAVRPWLDALREVWPEMRACPMPSGTWVVSRVGFAEDECDAFMSAGDSSGWLLGERHEKELVHYSTPAALVAALKKALGVPEPKPEPTRPALWEWVRAAEGSALGQAYVCRHQQPTESELQMWIDVDGSLGGEPDASVDDVPDVFITIDRHEARVYVARDEGGCNACCSTPAELTAALNALAEEVSRG